MLRGSRGGGLGLDTGYRFFSIDDYNDEVRFVENQWKEGISGFEHGFYFLLIVTLLHNYNAHGGGTLFGIVLIIGSIALYWLLKCYGVYKDNKDIKPALLEMRAANEDLIKANADLDE